MRKAKRKDGVNRGREKEKKRKKRDKALMSRSK